MLVKFLICLVVFYETQAQEGSFCWTPLRDPGKCMNIKQCDGLIILLRTQGNNPEVRSYLLRSSCGWNFGNEPLVCCPQLGRNENTPPETERPPPPPITQEITTSTPITEHLEDTSTSSTLPSAPQCGYDNKTSTRVIGGQPAQLGQFPWMVALGYRNSKSPEQPKWLCGGSLITDRHVLTAGHCVKDRDDLYIARVGDLDLYALDDGANPIDIPIINKKLHEQYDPQHFTNDIAVITLANKVQHPSVWPVCLPTNAMLRSQTFTGVQALVAGWGSTYYRGPSSSYLQFAQLPVVSTDTCRDAFTSIKQAIIDDRVVCAGLPDGKKDSCKGDSGGPLMIAKVHGEVFYYQIGVVSYGFKCGEPDYYGVYTRTSAFVDWVANNIQ